MNKTLHIGHHPIAVEAVNRTQNSVSFTCNGTSYDFQLERLKDGSYVLAQKISDGVWKRQTLAATRTAKGALRIALTGQELLVGEPRAGRSAATEEKPLSPRAPMPGLVRQILVKAGDKVANGQALVVMEAMKLQMTLAAGGDGIVERIAVSEGAMVEEGAELVVVTQKRA
ncbi:MAG: biotin/lipoyl-binding protein [Alphaproteobacteria bacterium]|nr:biotin/lipoyl-binding protein [Alphaproteobacteria bacterium]